MISRALHFFQILQPGIRLFLMLALLLCAREGGAATMEGGFDSLNDSHDIPDLPLWGPYSKKYAGFSHIPDLQKGIRFDFSVFPGYYRFKTLVPNVLFASDYYPWDANAAITRVTYRYELEWKDRVYVDVTYAALDTNCVLVAMHCVNDTAVAQNLDLNLMSFIDYPATFPSVKAAFPETTKWINAIHYRRLTHAHPRPKDNLVTDGWMCSEARSDDYLDGSAVAANFGTEPGDTVSYDIDLANPLTNGVIAIRYRAKPNERAAFQLHGISEEAVTFTGTGKFEMLAVPISDAASDSLTLESKGGGPIELNGFFAGPQKDAAQIRITPVEKKFVPQVTPAGEEGMILKYRDIDNYYGVAWNFSPSETRRFLNDEMDIFFRKARQNHVVRTFTGNSLGDYENIFLRPILLFPNSDKTIYALICNGSEAEVKRTVASFAASPDKFIAEAPASDNAYGKVLPEGRPYVFSEKMMRTAMLANLVYPVYTQGKYIRHFSPGKWWDSLYTWDEGLLASGLEEINTNYAVECLNAYTTASGSQSAFILHGTPLPTQAFAFFDLWNKTQSPELLRYFYPRLKQYYEFLAGNSEGSTTRTLNSHLLKTWDYFYSCGGWDDYPAQVAVHYRHLEGSTTPVVTTAFCIRFAKMLRMMAQNLSLGDDVKNYDADVAMFSEALQKYSWDSQSGYFSYVVHDAQGNPTGFLRTASGQNYDMGLDGAYPLFAGICTPEQETILLGKIFSQTNMWTRSGMGVVDQSAEYYRQDGYWNGAVWMPHQWYMWKTMLDLGRPDLAWTIAHKALEVWKTETDYSYNVFEHFLAETGRGAGWHQFTSLSAPVLNWFAAYYQPGTVTTGYEIFIEHQQFNPACTHYEADLAFDDSTSPHPRSLILCLNPGKYRVTFNHERVEALSPYQGILEVTLPATNAKGKLVVDRL
ncbi:MAG TPA: trehalase family glycosidase [Verrucomicrobiae bacterium]